MSTLDLRPDKPLPQLEEEAGERVEVIHHARPNPWPRRAAWLVGIAVAIAIGFQLTAGFPESWVIDVKQPFESFSFENDSGWPLASATIFWAASDWRYASTPRFAYESPPILRMSATSSSSNAAHRLAIASYSLSAVWIRSAIVAPSLVQYPLRSLLK